MHMTRLHDVLVLIVCALLWVPVQSIELPMHARHGQLYTLLQYEQQAARIDIKTPTPQWFQQRLDHFVTNASSATFLQRFYEDNTHWTTPDGPVILYIGGEGALEAIPSGFLHVLAQGWGAKIVALEHRFYGQSIPNNDLSTENLQYLSVQQALADLAFFQEQYQATLNASIKNPWIAIGGSYPGALSAWFRVAYPNSTVAALSSSGVVLPVYQFWEFDAQVALAVGPKCAQVLRQTTAAFEQSLVDGNGTAVKTLFGAQGLADPDFFYMLADAAAMAVQYGHKDQVCAPMEAADAAGTSLIDAFAAFTTKMYGAAFGHSCFYDTKCLASDHQRDRWAEGRSWRWQKCSQLAYFQVAPTIGSLRASMVDIAYHEAQCRTVFGQDRVHPEQGVQKIIKQYGGLKPPAHRVFFSNGADDPWQRASIVNNVSKDLIANLAQCDLCGHCGDLKAMSESVPTPLRLQQEEIIQVLTEWLEDSEEWEGRAQTVRNDAQDVAIEANTNTWTSSVWIAAAAIAMAVFAVVARIKLVRNAPQSRRAFDYVRLDTE